MQLEVSKVIVLTKERLGIYSQENICLNFNQAEINVKAVLIILLTKPEIYVTFVLY